MQKYKTLNTGTLYIVATPIGNLEDITFRAVRILKEADLIAAEDTRHTKKLLKHYDIQTKLISYYREKEYERAAEIIDKLLTGTTVALVSDAGTPGISDPGAILVNLAREAGIKVCPIPGSSALTTAISAGGLEAGTFLFLGFPPSKSGQRHTFLRRLASCEHPVILYESPRRIQSLLSDALIALGDRQAFWGRELTKTHEELHKNSLKELLTLASGQVNRGETVLIIFPEKIQRAVGENIDELLVWYRDHSGLSLKDACRRLASDLGLSRSDVYRKALAIWQARDENDHTPSQTLTNENTT